MSQTQTYKIPRLACAHKHTPEKPINNYKITYSPRAMTYDGHAIFSLFD